MKQKCPMVLEERRRGIVRILHDLKEQGIHHQDVAQMLETSNVTLTNLKKVPTYKSLVWLKALKQLKQEIEDAR